MNTQIFSDAMSELNEKYIMEAATFTAKKKSVARIWLSRVACVFLAVVLMGSAVLTFSVEARAAFFGWVRQQYETFYEYFFEGEPEITEPLQYSPEWMPEGCVFVTSYETAGGEVYIYTNENDTLIQFSYTSEPGKEKLYIDGVGSIEKPVTINGDQGTIYLSQDEAVTNALIWIDNEQKVLFSISADYDEDTLIKIAENIQVKEVQKKYSPSWLPEGCELLTVEETAGGETYIYKDKSGLLVQFYYIYAPDSQKLYIDTVEYISEPVSINGHSGEIYISIYDDETSSIVWIDNATNTLFYVSGPFEKDTLIKIAENIQAQE